MQKKLIALAVTALASGAAFAQSSVTVYGQIDIGFTQRSSGVAVQNWLKTGSLKSQNAINGGQSDVSKVGFKGVEDLGNGNQALFVLEAGFLADTGARTDNGSFFNEKAFLGLTGNWGTALAGRLSAPRYSFMCDMDPFGDGTVGRFGNVYEDYLLLGDMRINVATTNVFRANNAIAYVSPSFSGFNVTAAYATNAIGQEGVGNSLDARTYALLPRYTNGPLDIGLSWQRISIKDAKQAWGSKMDMNQWTLGATYDFSVVKLFAAYDDYRESLSSVMSSPCSDPNPAISLACSESRMKSWLLGLAVPFGKSAIQASYNQSKLDFGRGYPTGKATQWALGYTYDISRRTNFYAAYARITNSKKSDGFWRTAGVGDATSIGSTVDSWASPGNGGFYRSAFQFGLKHNF